MKFSHSEKARFWTLLLGAGITPNNQSLVPRWGLRLGILDGGGVFCSVLQIMTQFFRPNNGILTPVFRPGLKEIKSSLLRLKCQIKRCLANLFFLIHLELKREIRSYTPVDSFLKNHTRLQAKMSRVYTRFRTERGNIPPIWPVCKEYHPRPRRLYLIIFSLGVL